MLCLNSNEILYSNTGEFSGEILCLNLWWNLMFESLLKSYIQSLVKSCVRSRPDRQLVCPARPPVSCPPVTGAGCFSQKSQLLLTEELAASSFSQELSVSAAGPPSVFFYRQIFLLFCAQKELSKNLRKRREAIITGEARIGGETQHKFETRSTNNQWRTSAEMSRNPNAEMQVILSLKLKI